jgi:hypothetical protein
VHRSDASFPGPRRSIALLRRGWWPIVLALSASGCLLPWASPPAKVVIAGGASIGAIDDDDGTRRQFSRGTLQLRGGLHLLQLFPGAAERRFDVGFGYLGEFRLGEALPLANKHGPQLELAYHPWIRVERLDERRSRIARLAVVALPELLFARRDGETQVGGGGSIGVTLDWGRFSRGCWGKASGGMGGSAAAGGCAYGETSIGVGLSAGFRLLESERAFVVTGGVVFRLPASVGFVGIGK